MPTDAPPETDTPSPTLSRDEHLLAFVREHEARCPLCDYNLRGLSRPRCPECGQELKLDVRLAEPFLAAWVTLVVALSLAAGPGVFLALIIAMEGWNSLYVTSQNGLLVICYLLAAVPCAAVALVLRRRFCRLPVTGQALLAAVPVVADVLVLLWIAAQY